MFVRKIELLSSGNTLLSGLDQDNNEVIIKAFFPDSGVTMVDSTNIKISRQNGSDFYTFPWNKVNTLIGKSGLLPKPTSQQDLYKILFEEFLLLPQSSSIGSALVGMDTALAQDAQALPTRSDDYFDEIVDGKRAGISPFNKFGNNTNLTVADQVISSFGGVYLPMLAPDTLKVRSSEAADTSTGTVGAKTIKIVGLGIDGLPQEEIIALDGTNFVNTTQQWLGGVNRANVLTAGTNLKNVGNIDILPTNETDLTKLQARIPEGLSTTKQLIFHIPANHALKIYGFLFNAVKSGGGSEKLTVTAKILKDGILTEWLDIPLNSSSLPIINEEKIIPERFEGLASIWYNANIEGGAGRVSGRIQQTLTQII